MDLMFRLYEGLERLGPGSAASTARALALAGALPAGARILDIGCGTGAQTLDLLRQCDCHVTAVDMHQPFLDSLMARAGGAGLASRVRTLCADMNALELPDGAYDVLWSEGAIYHMGFDVGLTQWRRLLRPEGVLVVSEMSWFVDSPPQDALDFWREGYPQMRHENANAEAMERHGYELLGSFRLPVADWWDVYYADLTVRLEAFETLYGSTEEGRAIIDEQRREFDVMRRGGDSCGYVFYVARKHGQGVC